MKSKPRRQFDEDFKRRALKLADSTDKTIGELERELGIFQGGISRWRKEASDYSNQAFPGKGHLREEDEEMRRLRRELEITKMERDILKKAVVIFSQPPKAGTSL